MTDMKRLVSDLRAYAVDSFKHGRSGCNGTALAAAEYTSEEGLRYRVGCDACDERLVVRRTPPLRLSEYELRIIAEETVHG
jgi:hypothetical protein